MLVLLLCKPLLLARLLVELLQARPEQRVPEGAATALGAQDRRDLDQEELPDQRGAEDLSEVV